MDLQLQVKHGTETLSVTAAATCTVQQLKQQLEQLTGLFVRNQKLIFKGKVLADASTLEACKLITGSKVMLLQTEGLPVKVCAAVAAATLEALCGSTGDTLARSFKHCSGQQHVLG